MECAALSCVTNKAAGLSGEPLNHQEVLTNAARQTNQLAEVIEGFLRLLQPLAA
jgi:purine-nucleoside phosphorylase